MADALKIPITDAVTEETDFPWAIHFIGGDALAIQSEARGVGYTVYKAADLGLGGITRGMVAPGAHAGTYVVNLQNAFVTAHVVAPSIVASQPTQVGTYGNVDVGIERTDATGQLVTDSAAATRIRRLRDAFGISSSDVAKIIGAASDLVDDVESGRAKLPASYNAKLTDASRALDRLLGIFRRDRLASVIRRPARAFGGQTPLDWIREGRIEEVAERYDYGLAYQS